MSSRVSCPPPSPFSKEIEKILSSFTFFVGKTFGQFARNSSLSPVFPPPILIEKCKHAIHKEAIFFPSLQLLVNRSSIFSSQQILIYATLEARLQSTQDIVFSLASFRVPPIFRSDFNPDGNATMASRLAP
ncbi:hypothetical protein AVEN_207253-1 [Araneus ventricosus]|uniref:Uncharacterized protein n=1 Tax=Araneus ventricosus TaxID=182803 RepID=A0A4Y2T197_ARAVE|nr:hypothetical protein AVEN_268699-1 [Araneus ventricosus]GBO46277.1 hypothetical protein AVEN_207253-1 [Araneus ventricosus]